MPSCAKMIIIIQACNKTSNSRKFKRECLLATYHTHDQVRYVNLTDYSVEKIPLELYDVAMSSITTYIRSYIRYVIVGNVTVGGRSCTNYKLS